MCCVLRKVRPRSIWLIAAGGAAMHLAAATVWAQKPGRVPNEDNGWLQVGIALGLAVVICATAFLNPKRSHLT